MHGVLQGLAGLSGWTDTTSAEPTASFDNSWYGYLAMRSAQGGVNKVIHIQEPEAKPKPEPTEFQRLSNHQFHELLDQFEQLIAN